MAAEGAVHGAGPECGHDAGGQVEQHPHRRPRAQETVGGDPGDEIEDRGGKRSEDENGRMVEGGGDGDESAARQLNRGELGRDEDRDPDRERDLERGRLRRKGPVAPPDEEEAGEDEDGARDRGERQSPPQREAERRREHGGEAQRMGAQAGCGRLGHELLGEVGEPRKHVAPRLTTGKW